MIERKDYKKNELPKQIDKSYGIQSAPEQKEQGQQYIALNLKCLGLKLNGVVGYIGMVCRREVPSCSSHHSGMYK